MHAQKPVALAKNDKPTVYSLAGSRTIEKSVSKGSSLCIRGAPRRQRSKIEDEDEDEDDKRKRTARQHSFCVLANSEKGCLTSSMPTTPFSAEVSEDSVYNKV